MKEIWADPFRNCLVLVLAALGLFLLYKAPGPEGSRFADAKEFVFFFHPNCPHCQRQKALNQYLKTKYPALSFTEHDISIPKNAELLAEVLKRQPGGAAKIIVPVTVVGPYIFTGFVSAETSGARIERAIQAYLLNDSSLFEQAETVSKQSAKLRLPLLGDVRPEDYSLPVLAIVIGLADGFNPCAMWVLVYLISLIMAIHDRLKIWVLVGSFVFASGVLYFLFMTAWLNIFLFLGYLRPITIFVGIFAFGTGILHLRESVVTKGELVCKVGDVESKKKTMGRIERIVREPLSYFSLISIVALAFIVNSIEFACSAGLPAVFTHTLSLRHLSDFQYYGYILLYDFFFMLDDLIIFSLAVFALDTEIGNRYAKHCKWIGGIILIVLGLAMVFKPQWLR